MFKNFYVEHLSLFLAMTSYLGDRKHISHFSAWPRGNFIWLISQSIIKGSQDWGSLQEQEL